MELNEWIVEIVEGATYDVRIALQDAEGDPVVGWDAAEWRLTLYKPGGEAFYTSVSGDWTEVNEYTRDLTIPPSVTALFVPGIIQFDFTVIVSSTEVYPLVVSAQGNVLEGVGE